MELWNEIKEMFSESDKKIDIIPGEINNGLSNLKASNVNENSTFGSIIKNSAGITIDNWIFLFAQKNKQNKGIIDYKENGNQMVGYDAVGGIFSINLGKFNDGIGKLWYFSPIDLSWRNLEISYAEFIAWIAQSDLDEFYDFVPKNELQENCEELKMGKAILFYPLLCSDEFSIATASKVIVSFDELYKIEMELSSGISN